MRGQAALTQLCPNSHRRPATQLPQSEEEVVSVVREAQVSLRVIDADNIDEMADDILAEEEADDLLEGEGNCP